MGFLAPALLMLGAAAVIPVLLHLLQRHQGPRVVFPALRYLRRAEKESARRIRLRQILLLLLRVAALLLLALAAARPFIRGAGASHEPTAVAIILDNSMSSAAVVDDRRVLDVLAAHALETLLRAGPDDRFWLIRAGSPHEPALPGDATATAARVRATEPTPAASDLDAAVAHAAALLATGAAGRAREIQILSDAQRTAFPAPPGALDDVAIVAWVSDRDVPPNRAVGSVEIGGGLAPIAGERSTVAVAVHGTGSDTVGVRLALEGRTVAAGSTPIGSSAVLPFPVHDAGLVAGHVEIDADALRADDRRHFATRVRPPPAVGFTGSNTFIRDALDVLAEAGRIRRANAAPDIAQLVAAAGIVALRPGVSAIILPPTTPIELAALNRRLAAALIPWRYEAHAGGGEARIVAGAGTDGVLQPLEGVRIREWYALERVSASPDSVLLALSDGSPWAVRGNRAAGGVYVLIASPLVEAATTLPTSSAMLPLVDRLTGAWTAASVSAPTAAPGATVALPADADAVVLPDGTREPLGTTTTYRVTGPAGVYRILAGADTVAAFAVDSPPAESDLARLSADELRAHFEGADVVTVSDADDWPMQVYQQRLGAESWRPFALLAFLVLLGETLLAASGRAAHTRGTATAPTTPMSPQPGTAD
ncbi:MAG: BatA domain-containing protein [Longimicrobiales bacterium]